MTDQESQTIHTIWKYALYSPVEEHEMPVGAEIIDVRTQDRVPTLWVWVNPYAPSEKRTFVGFGTGQMITESGLKYVGTAHDVENVDMVFHIFERPRRDA